MSTLMENEGLIPPFLNDSDTEMAIAAEKLIMASLDHSLAATITIQSDDGSTPNVEVSPQILQVIAKTLRLMAQRQPIMLIPLHQEFSTVEAANYLKVSRPFLIKEIEAGKIKHRMVGTHRRIVFSDLIEYSNQMRHNQQAALNRMADNARELGLDYE